MALLGLAAATVGVLQLASGNANWLRFYEFTHHGFATGFQANRNADADILLIAVIAATAWAALGVRSGWSRQVQVLLVAALLFLVLSVVLTGSRTGVALISVAVIAAAAMLLRKSMLRSWKVIAAGLTGLAVIGASAYLLSNNTRVGQTLGRFSDVEAIRPEIWKDTVYAIGQHWPVGSGIGTFQPIFAASERLEFVRPDFSNRAHNDYLEFLLEAGVVAPLFILVIVIFTGVRLTRMLMQKAARDRRIAGIFVLGSLLVLLMHSLVDYPERSLSLAVVSGMLAGLLGRVGIERSGRRSEGVVG
nr:O-antigen ligase family protein [Hephaestia mangrovi]